MTTHSSILAWRIPWAEEPGGAYSPWGCKESDMTERLTFVYIHTYTGLCPQFLVQSSQLSCDFLSDQSSSSIFCLIFGL